MIRLFMTGAWVCVITLAAAYGHRVHLNIVIDPAVMGGISVQIGDELIDATAARRLAAVRRKLAG